MHKLYKALPLLFASLLLTGCPEPEVRKETDTMKINKWVYAELEKDYLWAHSLEGIDDIDLTLKTTNYFNGLIFGGESGDIYPDRFSEIKYVGDDTEEETRAGTAAGEMGFGFRFVFLNSTDMRVLYVMKGSPAEDAGLERGDRIVRIGDTSPNSSNYSGLMSDLTISVRVSGKEDTPLEMTQRMVYDNPVYYSEIFEEEGLENTAYLVYNHFTDGNQSINSQNYQKSLRDTFKVYRDRGVRNLILDFRYNGGGEVENARRLASLIGRREWTTRTGSARPVFFYTESKRSYGNPSAFTENYFMNSTAETAANADIEKLYVITSQLTASASELIIHCLRPFYGDDLAMIGEDFIHSGSGKRVGTLGKNVGGYTIEGSPTYDWEISLMTMRVYDNTKESGYEGGLFPDNTGDAVSEWNMTRLAPFGDKDNDPMLRHILIRYFGYTIPNQIAGGGSDGGSRSTVPADGTVNVVTNIPERGLWFPAPTE